ncbi:latexin-like [Pantherophis guttatus]|uniref:Latexin-like n=1 Tax=Pantherophis guttatus TaxID=94885 RepID=A0A6P9DFU2_PANGU|nr:latexin-like [Pantherophis guttatus]
MRLLGGSGAPARLLQLLLPASLVLADPEWPLRAATGSAQALPGKVSLGGQQRSPASAMEIPPSHYPANRAAGAVLHYLTYQRGSPHRLFEMGRVNQASLEDIPGTGHKYHLKFEVKEIIQNGSFLNCTAEILYHHGDTPIAPEIHYTMEEEFETHLKEADNIFYNRIQHLSEPLETKKIPDNDGNVPAEMKPIFNLAKVASGYIVWQNSTENTWYNMIQIQNVKQVKRNDDYLEFSYEVSFHDIASQEIIPWHMQVLWHPQHGVKVAQNSRQSK